MYSEKDILLKFKTIHGNLYDYSNVNYKHRLEKVKILCKQHGAFEQTPAAHMVGQGCPLCGSIKRKNKKRISFDEFVFRAKQKHGDKYTYFDDSYLAIESPCKIICPIHGEFIQVPKGHIKGYGCPKCGKIETGKKLSSNSFEFIQKARKLFVDKFKYEKVVYVNNITPVIIICPEHGEFSQKPNYHLLGNGCPECGGTKRLTQEEFIEKSNFTHNNKYDYSKVNYKNNKTKVIIICKKHGEFTQSPSHHMNGSGCQRCNESKGEKLIQYFLNKMNINFDREKRFDGCRHRKKLPFDFYLPDYNMCIEYDGEQHFETWRMSNSESAKKRLEEIKTRDKIKTDFCQNNNISLCRIKYTDNIEFKLKKAISGK